MKILGVDPGLTVTGYGVIDSGDGSCGFVLSGRDSHGKLLETGTITPARSDLMQDKIGKVYKHLNDIILQFAPEVMVLEKIYVHARHPATAFILGHVRGAICLLCAQHRLKLVEYSVKRIRKAIVGSGSASKQQIREAVARIFRINVDKLTLDASDALALALGYAQMEGSVAVRS